MSLEQHVIRILLSKEGYEANRSFVKIDDFETNLKKVVRVIDRLYNKGAESIELEDLKIVLMAEYPSLKKDVRDLLFDMLDKVYKIDGGDVVHKEVMRNYRNKQVAGKLGELSLRYIDNPDVFNINELNDIINTYNKSIDGTEEEVEWDNSTFEELMETSKDDYGYSWPWESFNRCVGRLKGRLGLIFAYPNKGKSALIYTALAHFIRQTKVLLINNEEDGDEVQKRIRSCYTEMTEREMLLNPGVHQEEWNLVANNFIFKDDANMDIPTLKKYIKASGADIVIIDQAVKIKVKKVNDRRDVDLGIIFRELREICKDNELEKVNIIGVGRGDKDSENAQKIKITHLSDSKSEVQGELDFMIGMQRFNEGDMMKIFFLKTKGTGKEGETDTLELRREISRVYDIKH